jgi:hypothetical protein
MNRPRWSGTELSKELTATLASAETDASNEAIARVRARLADALGPAFQAEPQLSAAEQPAGPERLLTPNLWLGLGAALMIGVGLVLWSPDDGARRQPRAAVHVVQPNIVQPAKPQGRVAADELLPLTAAADNAPVGQQMAITPSSVRPPLARDRQPAAKRKPGGAELGLAEELRQLTQIRRQLKDAPALALLEADAHAQRFAHGTLGPERELLRVEALLRLDRRDEAQEVAARMLATPGGHPYRAQVVQLLGAD